MNSRADKMDGFLANIVKYLLFFTNFLVFVSITC